MRDHFHNFYTYNYKKYTNTKINLQEMLFYDNKLHCKVNSTYNTIEYNEMRLEHGT